MGFFSSDAEDDVVVSSTFPETNPFGLIVNGEQNSLNLHMNNQGKKNYTLVSASASYHDAENHWALVKNASTLRYGVPLVSGSNFSVPFTVHSEFRPKEIGLTVWVNLAESGTTDIHSIVAMNQTVSVVEPPTSWLDPGLLFVYLFLTTALAGGAYWAYNTFVKPQPKRKGGAKDKTRTVRAMVPAEKGNDYPNVKAYDEDFIPAHHLKSRTTKLKKEGGGDVTSGDEATSGGETSGGEGKARKRRGKKA